MPIAPPPRTGPHETVVMNLKLLDTFLRVARLKSFRLAAEQLQSTPAAVAGRVSTLEEDLGVKLLLRDPRAISLTVDGHKVLEYAERMLEMERDLRQALEARNSGIDRLRVGVLEVTSQGWFSAWLARVAVVFPDLEVEFSLDSASNLRQQLFKGHLDLIVQTDSIRHESIRNCLLGSYPMIWVAAPTHPAPGHLSELEGARLLTLARNSRLHQDLLGLLQASGIDSPRLACIDSSAMLLKLVVEGRGIGVLPLPLVAELLRLGPLRQLESLPLMPVLEVVASWRAGPGLEHIEDVVELAQTLVRG